MRLSNMLIILFFVLMIAAFLAGILFSIFRLWLFMLVAFGSTMVFFYLIAFIVYLSLNNKL